MTVKWTILSPLSSREMLEVERECERALEHYLQLYPECADRWGEFSAGGSIPTRSEVATEYHRYRLRLPDGVAARLASCRSVMTIERPGRLEADGLQASLMRFILERTGKGLVIFNDYPMEETEVVLAGLRHQRGAPGFARLPEDRAPHRGAGRLSQAEGRSAVQSVARGGGSPRAAEPPAEVRAARLLDLLQKAETNVELAIDIRDALARLPRLARRYVSLIFEEGVMDDIKAARKLGGSEEEMQSCLRSLDQALREIES